MDYFGLLLTAVAAVVLITIIVIVAVKHPEQVRLSSLMANYVDSPWDIYCRSGGYFDEAARLALQRATNHLRPAAIDYITAALAIGYNFRTSHADLLNPSDNDWVQADAYKYFSTALDLIAQDAPAAGKVVRRKVGRVGLLLGRGAAPVTGEFVIDIAECFATTWGGAGTGAEAKALIEKAKQCRRAVTQRWRSSDRLSAAGTAKYFAAAAVSWPAPAGVLPDMASIASMAAIVNRLRADAGVSAAAGATADTSKEIISGILDAEGRNHLELDAFMSVKTIMAEPDFTDATSISDKECLQLVWLRAKDSRNADTADEMRAAIIKALEKMWIDGVQTRCIVSPNRRAALLLGALAEHDWDVQNHTIHTTHAMKKELYRIAHEKIVEIADAYMSADDPQKISAGEAFHSTVGVPLDAAAASAAAAEMVAEMTAAVKQLTVSFVTKCGDDLGVVMPQWVIDGACTETLGALAAPTLTGAAPKKMIN